MGSSKMLLGSVLYICTIFPLLVALRVQNEYDPVVLKDCYSYKNMDNFLTMGTLKQIRCLQQYMLTSNNGIKQHKLNHLLRIPISLTYLRNGGIQVLDSLPKIGSKIYDLRPQTFKQLTGLIKNRAKRSVKHKSKSVHTHYSKADLEQIARDIIRDSPAPKITDRFPIPWNSTEIRTNRTESVDTHGTLDQAVNFDNLVKHIDKHRS